MRKLTERGVVDLMRDGRRHLVQMQTVGGKKWFLVPGGEVKGEIAQALHSRPDIQPSNDGLFPAISQTFKFRPIGT
jgi:hypothetical protein